TRSSPYPISPTCFTAGMWATPSNVFSLTKNSRRSPPPQFGRKCSMPLPNQALRVVDTAVFGGGNAAKPETSEKNGGEATHGFPRQKRGRRTYGSARGRPHHRSLRGHRRRKGERRG